MSESIFQISDAEYNNPLASVITDYAAAEQFENDKWADAMSIAVAEGCEDKGHWESVYLIAEEEQVSARERLGEVVKRTKAGKIVASKAFPKTWNTDKAIIGKALDSGISLTDDDGKIKPKSALQEEYKEVPKEERSAMEKILTTINTYGALYDQLTDDEKELARTAIGVIHTNS